MDITYFIQCFKETRLRLTQCQKPAVTEHCHSHILLKLIYHETEHIHCLTINLICQIAWQTLLMNIYMSHFPWIWFQHQLCSLLETVNFSAWMISGWKKLPKRVWVKQSRYRNHVLSLVLQLTNPRYVDHMNQFS